VIRTLRSVDLSAMEAYQQQQLAAQMLAMQQPMGQPMQQWSAQPQQQWGMGGMGGMGERCVAVCHSVLQYVAICSS